MKWSFQRTTLGVFSAFGCANSVLHMSCRLEDIRFLIMNLLGDDNMAFIKFLGFKTQNRFLVLGSLL